MSINLELMLKEINSLHYQVETYRIRLQKQQEKMDIIELENNDMHGMLNRIYNDNRGCHITYSETLKADLKYLLNKIKGI